MMRVFCNDTVQFCDRHFIAVSQHALKYAADRQAPEIVVVVEIRHQKLQRPVGIARRRRDVLENGLEQGTQIVRIVFHG